MVLLINSDRILTKIMLKTLIKIELRYRYRLNSQNALCEKLRVPLKVPQ